MKADARGPAGDDGKKRNLFRRHLLAWYDRHQRELPWRRDRDPYRVWVSEVMLQQTRVAAVLEHYRRFLERFPTLEQLAAAPESSVLAEWSGLGYYRRARMLQAAARKVVQEMGGRLPAKARDLRKLPGIGRYTAAAIASIAFGERSAVVDGNVERVLQRVLGQELSGEQMWQAAESFLGQQRTGDFNQAMMELGATVCLPRRPPCQTCPVADWCATRGELGKPRRTTPQRKREIGYSLARRNGSVFLVKRGKQAALMPGMWELPQLARRSRGAAPWLRLRHSITNTDYVVRVSKGAAPKGQRGRWVAIGRIGELPLTGLARKILRAARVI
jgi:A/G-specific adenine glycosylase